MDYCTFGALLEFSGDYRAKLELLREQMSVFTAPPPPSAVGDMDGPLRDYVLKLNESAFLLGDFVNATAKQFSEMDTKFKLEAREQIFKNTRGDRKKAKQYRFIDPVDYFQERDHCPSETLSLVSTEIAALENADVSLIEEMEIRRRGDNLDGSHQREPVVALNKPDLTEQLADLVAYHATQDRGRAVKRRHAHTAAHTTSTHGNGHMVHKRARLNRPLASTKVKCDRPLKRIPTGAGRDHQIRVDRQKLEDELRAEVNALGWSEDEDDDSNDDGRHGNDDVVRHNTDNSLSKMVVEIQSDNSQCQCDVCTGLSQSKYISQISDLELKELIDEINALDW